MDHLECAARQPFGKVELPARATVPGLCATVPAIRCRRRPLRRPRPCRSRRLSAGFSPARGRMSAAGQVPTLLAAPFRQGETEVALVPSRERAELREPEQIRNIRETALVAFEIAFREVTTHVIHE